jgi:hypothetical protein
VVGTLVGRIFTTGASDVDAMALGTPVGKTIVGRGVRRGWDGRGVLDFVVGAMVG